MPARTARRNPPAVAMMICVALVMTAAGARAQERLAERAQTRPATDTTTSRRMLWDRTKAAAELAREAAAVEREVKVLVREVESGDGRRAAELKAARAELQALRAAAAEVRRELAAGAAAPATERAAYLGVTSSPADAVLGKQLRLPEGVGLVVDYVEPASPAAEAGLQPYDVAVRLNEQILINPQQLAVLVRTFEPGTDVTLAVVREGKERPIVVKLVERDVKPLADVVFGVSRVARPALAGRVPAATRPAGAEPTTARTTTAAAAPDALLDVGDELKVTVYDVEGPGLRTVVHTRVPPEGMLRIPHLRQRVVAFRRSAAGLQKAIVDAYRAERVAEQANVSVERVRKHSDQQE